MAKMMSRDSQIILNMLRVQDKINDVLFELDTEDKIENSKKVISIDVLNFYILKLVGLSKNFSGKTKKAIGIFNESKTILIQKSVQSCFPLVSDSEVISYARSLADDASKAELKARYEVCIKESENYNA